MRVDPLSWSETAGWGASPGDRSKANLVLYFGARQALACGARYHELRAMFPEAHILGCSTGGQIRNNDVSDGVWRLRTAQPDHDRHHDC
jgi:hypothetical protein